MKLNPFSILLGILLYFTMQAGAQTTVVKGKVMHAVTREPLPFVSITWGNARQGGTSDLSGNFIVRIPETEKELRFSFVGFSPLVIPLNGKAYVVAELYPVQYELNEVQIFPGENPAHRIIRNATDAVGMNDPMNKKSFSYTSYNKTVFTADVKNLRKADSIAGGKDTSLHRLTRHLDSADFFIMEFVSERLYRKPGLNSETVIGSRVSGFSNPAFTILSSQLQSFAFYEPLIKIGDKSYLNPISIGSTNKYFFLLEDTLYQGNDSVFIISFRPRKNKNFDGLKGLLYINTDGWAIQNVIAEPTEPQSGTTMKIQQQYEKADGKHWFPVQMNTDITFNNAEVNGSSILSLGRTYIYNVVIDSLIPRKNFGMSNFIVDPKAPEKDDAFWQQHRTDSLNRREMHTYHFMDSIGKKENFDKRFRNLEAFLLGKIPWKILDFDLVRIFDGNDYEGFRSSLDVHTNNKLAQWFSVGGYAAYGFKDKQFKYGYDAWIRLWKPREVKLAFRSKNDLSEKGETLFPFSEEAYVSSSFSSGAYRNYLITDMDDHRYAEISLSSRLMKYLMVRVSLSHSYKEMNNEYRYIHRYFNPDSQDDEVIMLGHFSIGEFHAGFRFAYREEFMDNFRTRLSMGTKYPVVYGQYTKALGTLFPVEMGGVEADYNYSRYDVRVDKVFTFRNIGKSAFRIQCGWVVGLAPLCNLYNAPASYKPWATILPGNSFTTMRMNEFFTSRYASLFFTHNFGRLLLKKKFFRPDILVAHNLIYGDMSHSEKHAFLSYDTPSQGYHETGLILNNLLRVNFFGLGFGTYLRHGYYAFPTMKDNLAFRMTLTFVM